MPLLDERNPYGQNTATGVAPPPQLTLEAAQAYAAYDAARAAEAPPQLSIGPAPIPFTPAAQSPTFQIPAYTPPTVQTQVVDRVGFLQQQQQQEAEARQMAQALQAQQEHEARQRALAYAQQQANTITGGMYGVLRNTVTTTNQIASGQRHVNELGGPVNVMDFGYDPQNSATWADAQAKAIAVAKQTGGTVVFPGQDQTIGQGAAQFAGQAVQGAQNFVNETGLNQHIPGSQYVADVAGQIGRRAGESIGGSIGGPFAPVLDRVLPDALTPTNIAGKIGEVAAETLVPTEVWQAAIELVPGVGTVPDLLKAVKAGAPEAISALLRAGEKFGAREDVQKVLAKVAEEQGMSKIPGKAAESVAPEVAAANAERIASLEAQKARVNEALKVLRSGEATKAKTGVKGLLDVAERYPAGTPQRDALMTALEPMIAHLPEPNQKFIRAAIETLPSKAERRAATELQRARQATNAAEAFAGSGSETEKAIKAFQSMGGKQAQRFDPVGGQFTDAEVADLLDQIRQARDANKIGWFERANANSSMNLLLTGRRLPIASDLGKPLNLMPHEITLLGRIYGKEFEMAVPKTARHMSNFDKFVDVLNLPRALVTALDFSAAGRQGIVLAARNPVEWAKSFAPMIKAMGSEQGFERVGQNIRSNAKYEDAVLHGLEITDIGGGSGAEEAFISHIASKLPFVRGSERGYVAYLDNLRMLTYEKYANRLEKYGEKKGWDLARTDTVKEQIAKFLNHATGRGDLSGLDKYTPAMNAVFFSPKYFVSRPQSVWDMVRPGADKFTRQVAFENLGAFVGTGMAMLKVASLAGADVELNPLSSDFGKMRIGNTRIDFWAGYQPIARYIAQIASAHTKNATTGEIKFANPGDTAMRFFRSKLSPGGAAIYDYLPGKQKDYAGNDLVIPLRDLTANKGLNYDTGALAWNTFATKLLPLSIQDAISGYRSQGDGWEPTKGKILGGLTGAGVSAIGGGISSYEPNAAQTKVIAKNQSQGSLKQAGVPYSSEGIDFRQPQLDGKPNGTTTQRQALADQLKITGLADDASMSAIRKAYLDQKVQAYMDAQKVSEPVARKALGDAFDHIPAVATINKNAETAIMNYWKAHPDLLKQAIDSGETPPSKEKQAILDGAGLK